MVQFTAPPAENRPEISAGLWLKCKGCEQMIAQFTLEQNAQVCPHCGYHYPCTAQQRLDLLLDANSFIPCNDTLHSSDVLNFADDGSYAKKLVSSTKKTGLNEAVVTGFGTIQGHKVAIAVMDFRFMGASMGSAVGEKITRLTEEATEQRLPLIIVSASGGARMQEGALSLMQMAKTSAALMRHDEAGLPYFTVLTNPTTGGVTASFASLGDVILAEPKALIGFAGRRVIENTIHQKLPADFQTSEYLEKHGFIDKIVERKDMKHFLAKMLGFWGF